MALIQSVVNFIKRSGDIFFPGRNGAYILIGTDRKDTLNSGYGEGGKNDKSSAAIDIVAGYKKENPDYINDSSRIYISQKTDPDEYFAINAGEKITGQPSIVIKSDNVYIKPRNNFKIVNDKFSILISEDGTINIENNQNIRIKSGQSTIDLAPSGDITLGQDSGQGKRILTEQDVCVGIDPTTGIPIKSTFVTSIGIDNPLGGKVNNGKIKIR